jgi:hypothetical protein
MPNDISPLVPTELLVAVLTEQLDENIAIARGLLADRARSEKERRAIILGTAPPGYRPCGSPPWHEP